MLSSLALLRVRPPTRLLPVPAMTLGAVLAWPWGLTPPPLLACSSWWLLMEHVAQGFSSHRLLGPAWALQLLLFFMVDFLPGPPSSVLPPCPHLLLSPGSFPGLPDAQARREVSTEVSFLPASWEGEKRATWVTATQPAGLWCHGGLLQCRKPCGVVCPPQMGRAGWGDVGLAPCHSPGLTPDFEILASKT